MRVCYCTSKAACPLQSSGVGGEKITNKTLVFFLITKRRDNVHIPLVTYSPLNFAQHQWSLRVFFTLKANKIRSGTKPPIAVMRHRGSKFLSLYR